MKYYWAIKKNELLIYPTTWMILEQKKSNPEEYIHIDSIHRKSK